MSETSYKPGTTQSKAYTDSAGQLDAQIGAYQARIWCSTDAFIAIGSNPTATSAGMPMTAKLPETIDCLPTDKISAIRQSSDGTLYVTPLSKE